MTGRYPLVPSGVGPRLGPPTSLASRSPSAQPDESKERVWSGADDVAVSSDVSGGLFVLAGVVLGAVLNAAASTRTRKEVSEEERERERRQRELLVAERLDEALVRASAAGPKQFSA